MTKKEQDEKIALFADALDLGDQGDTCLEDRLMIAKKDHIGGCSECGGDCLKGTVNRVVKWALKPAGLIAYRYCEKCLNEMVRDFSYDEDDGCDGEDKEDV